MSKHSEPKFQFHAQVWDLGHGVIAVPRYNQADAKFGASLLELVGTHYASERDVIHVIEAHKYVAKAGTAGTTTCPTSSGPMGPPPIEDEICRRHPPYNDSMTQEMMLFVPKNEGHQIFTRHASLEDARKHTHQALAKETCYWVLKTDKHEVFSIAFQK